MADWSTAYNWMMDNEDTARACAQVPDAPPAGVPGPCYAISGINSGAFPAQFDAIAALAQSEREPAVQSFYQDHFWNPFIEMLESDELCKRVFDFAVNAGIGTSTRCLQKAINSLGPASPIAEDGSWGPATVAAANAADPDALVAAFKACRLAHYQAIVAAYPADARYLAAWSARAQK